MRRMRSGGYRYQNTCKGCECPLDAGEGSYCDDCKVENAKIEAYAKRWNLTTEQVRELSRKGLISA